jgi:pSer/pThr/pTyr-binding forkhead associated (FHA) protein
MAKLIFIDKNFLGKTYNLVLEKTTIGRGDQNTLVIRDPSLSGLHCEILMNGPEIIVRDLDSLNGTYVGGVKLNKQAQAKSGQTVRFGSVEARLELGPEPTENDTAEITAVYALGKVLRDKRRAEKQPKAGPAGMQLTPENEGVPEEQTILIPRTAPTPAAAANPGAMDPERASSGSCRVKKIIFAVLALGALVVVGWLWWSRK